MPELFCKTLANFLINRKIEIKINGVCSEPFTPKSGVPQGSIIGPLMYLMFINDAPLPKKAKLVNKEGYRSEINTYFADDNIIMTSGYQDCPPRGNSVGQFGNERFREIEQKMTNWEEAHRIKTMHPRNKEYTQENISYKLAHHIRHHY